MRTIRFAIPYMAGLVNLLHSTYIVVIHNILTVIQLRPTTHVLNANRGKGQLVQVRTPLNAGLLFAISDVKIPRGSIIDFGSPVRS